MSRPQLVFRAGFAGKRELDPAEKARLDAVLRSVLATIGTELAAVAAPIAPGAGQETPVAPYFANTNPVLRLVTGLCEGADLAAGDVHAFPDETSASEYAQPNLTRELAAVVPFAIDEYRASRDEASWPAFDRQLAECALNQ